ERVIGAGGMGIVLKAFDTELNRPVAVKVLARHLSGVGAARQRFARESRAAAAVVHEHVVAIHNVEADQDVPYLVMQFVAGESLQDRVDRDGPLDVRQLLRIGSQIASGLTAAHEQGVVHRDVKPSNILLENGIERVLITDFGLARTVDDASLTRTGVIAGTPAYMSPEQANGDVADHQSDLFSLGSLIYFMATGHPPFRADRAMGVLNRICTHRHKPLWQVADQVPDELSVLVDQLLEKRPAKRIASAEEVHDRLAAILASVQQPRSSMLHRVKRWYYRYPRQLAAVGASVLVLSAAAIAVLSSGTSETNPASFEQPSKKLQPRDTTEPQTHVPANAFLVFDVNESNAFNESIESMHRQLDTLAEPVSISPVDQPNTTDLQSLLQRLEQLQQSPKTESPLN
ncbi:MAG TPA: serine/threonine protein kinase, partial [Planctomycetaceae bacterium]|nr:serine/threonine protein kinase [Planctomycetaceae bacterium]